MKNTKRFLSIALLTLSLGLTACGGSGGTTAPTSGGDTTTAAQGGDTAETQPSPTPTPDEDAVPLSTVPSGSPEDSATPEPSAPADNPIRMSVSDITNMDSDILNIILAMPHSGDFSLDITLGDTRIEATRYNDGHELVDYKIYDATGSEVFAMVTGQNEPFGIWVELYPPEDFDWKLDSVSTVKIEYSDDDGNKLSDEYSLEEILISENDARSWFSDARDKYESEYGSNTPSQSADNGGDDKAQPTSPDGLFDIAWVNEEAFALTVDRTAEAIIYTLQFDYLAESYIFEQGSNMGWELVVYDGNDSVVWVASKNAWPPDVDFILDPFILRQSNPTSLTASFDYQSKTITFTETLGEYRSQEPIRMEIRANVGSDEASVLLNEE